MRKRGELIRVERDLLVVTEGFPGCGADVRVSPGVWLASCAKTCSLVGSAEISPTLLLSGERIIQASPATADFDRDGDKEDASLVGKTGCYT